MENDDTPKKRGPGRPEGAASRLAKESRLAAQATGKLPHEILLDMARGMPQAIYRIDKETGEIVIKDYAEVDLETRRTAAAAAAPYYAPKISTVEVIHGMHDNDLDAIIAQLAAQAGLDSGLVGEGAQSEGAQPVRERVRTVH